MIRSAKWLSVATGLLVITPAAHLSAQDQPAQPAHRHAGFWIGFGLGVGVTVDDANLGGASAVFRLGGTLSQRLLLGAEIDFWARGKGQVVHTRSNLVGTATFYPSGRGGFYLKGGLGSRTTTSAPIRAADPSTSGLMVGA